MENYQGNSKRAKENPLPEKKIEKAIVGEVILKKKPMGRRFKDLIARPDFGNAVKHVVTYTLAPAAIHTIVKGLNDLIEMIFYGERGNRYRSNSGSHFSYHSSPLQNRSYNDIGYSRIVGQRAPAVDRGPRRTSRHDQDDVILTSRKEAELVLEGMIDVIENYEAVSVADLNDLLGLPTTHTDYKWGWVYLGDVPIRQVREGFLIDLPPAEPIQT